MRTEDVRPYFVSLKKKRLGMIIKRVFDFVVVLIMLIILTPIMVDSKRGVYFRQERVTQYCRKFRMHKFRTMVDNAERIGTQVTVANDVKVTKIGGKIRKCHLEDLPQLIDILLGINGIIRKNKVNLEFISVLAA